MIFNTFVYYLAFLLPAAVLFRCVPDQGRAPVCALFGAGFFIYFSVTTVGGWAGALCLVLFLWESAFSRLYRQGSRICWLGIGIAVAVLFAFKYWNFFTGLIAAGNQGNPWRWADAFLPLGISFFTFEFIHYAVDRYRGKTEAGSAWEYLAFILFFPTMVAGPIKRYQDFLPALRNPSRDVSLDWERGITRILCGLAKKFAIADLMTSMTIHLNSSDISVAERWILPVWLLAYAIQIYMDFSAYSDIAIGSARLFGIRVKENFDWPYSRTNISAFWQSWHMSLTRWLTDYVYIPLGGSRAGWGRVHLNVVVTFLVSGLWHGAGLNFLAWGLWHGLLLCLHRAWTRYRPANLTVPFRIGRIAAWALTFVCVVAGWSVFVMDLPTALQFWRKLLDV